MNTTEKTRMSGHLKRYNETRDKLEVWPKDGCEAKTGKSNAELNKHRGFQNTVEKQVSE